MSLNQVNEVEGVYYADNDFNFRNSVNSFSKEV